MNKVHPQGGSRHSHQRSEHPARRIITLVCAAGVGIPVFASVQSVLPLPWAVFSAVAASAIAYFQVRPGEAP